MGWGYCGKDKDGRGIGYNVSAVCDHPGCNKKIDRGLAFACGEMHGEDELSCHRYYCTRHLTTVVEAPHNDRFTTVCESCRKALLDSGDWIEDDGALVPNDKGERFTV